MKPRTMKPVSKVPLCIPLSALGLPSSGLIIFFLILLSMQRGGYSSSDPMPDSTSSDTENHWSSLVCARFLLFSFEINFFFLVEVYKYDAYKRI